MRTFSLNPHSLKRSKVDFESNRNNLQLSRTLKAKRLPNTINQQSLDHKATIRSKPMPTTAFKQASVLVEESKEDRQYISSIVDTLNDTLTSEYKLNLGRQAPSLKYVRNFYYQGLSRVVEYPAIETPEVVLSLFNDRKLNHKPSFRKGYLKCAGSIYYCIENTLVLFKTIDLLRKSYEPSWELPYTKIEIRNRVTNILQVNGRNQIFPNHDHLILTIHPWEIQFWAWDQADNRLTRLMAIYQLPVEQVREIDYSADGRLFFFDEQAALHEICPQQTKKFFFHHTGKYTLRNKINKSRNTLEIMLKKDGPFAITKSIFNNISQLSKLIFPSYVDTLKIFCDRERGLVFALLRKTTQALFSSEKKKFVVCYDISKGHSQLMHKFSEETFYDKFGSHIKFETSKTFQIHSIFPISKNNSKSSSANLCIMTASGCQIHLQVIENGCTFQQIVRPPDIHMFSKRHESKINDNALGNLLEQWAPNQTKQYQIISSYSQNSKDITILRSISRGQQGIYENSVAYLAFHPGIRLATDQNIIVERLKLQACRGKLSSEIVIDKVLDSTPVSDFIASHAVNQIENTLAADKAEEGERVSKKPPLELYSEIYQQTLMPPSIYLIHCSESLQYIAHLRQIDLIFTIIWLKTRKYNPTYRTSHKSTAHIIKLHQLLEILFIDNSSINNSNGFLSLLGSSPPYNLSPGQLVKQRRREVAGALFQIMIDKDGRYLYSGQCAQQISDIQRQIILQKIKKQQQIKSARNDFEWQRRKKRTNTSYPQPQHHHRNVQGHKFVEFEQFSQQMLSEIVQAFDHLTTPSHKTTHIDDFNSIRTLHEEGLPEGQRIFDESSQTIMEYITRILCLIWQEKLSTISLTGYLALRQLLIRKIRYVRSFLNTVEVEKLAKKQFYSQEQTKAKTKIFSKNLQFLDRLLRKIEELLCFLQILPLPPTGMTFHECIRKPIESVLAESIFNSIQRQFKPIVIHQWRAMFPTLISEQIVKVIRLYGEIDEIEGKKQVIMALSQQNIISVLPDYFVNYLILRRGLTESQIKQCMGEGTHKYFNNKRLEKGSPNLEDSEDEGPDISDKLTNILRIRTEKDLNTRDLNKIIYVLTDCKMGNDDEDCLASTEPIRSSIRSKFYAHSAVNRKLKYIRSKSSPDNQIIHQLVQQIDFIGRCICAQYQIYKTYRQMLKQLNKNRENQIIFRIMRGILGVFFKKAKLPQRDRLSEDENTQYLLKYELMADRQTLKDLAWSTGNLLLMSYHCAIFLDADCFEAIFRDLYDSRLGVPRKQERQYYNTLVQNIALKSEFDLGILEKVCKVWDSRKSQEVTMRNIVKKWLSFKDLDRLTQDQIWFPSMLLSIGYKPKDLLAVYTEQMSDSFRKLQFLELQTMYCLKFINCCVAISRGDRTLKKDFVEIKEFYFNALQRTKRIEGDVYFGMKKMLDEL